MYKLSILLDEMVELSTEYESIIEEMEESDQKELLLEILDNKMKFIDSFLISNNFINDTGKEFDYNNIDYCWRD